MKTERICYWTLIFALVILSLYQWRCTGRKPCPTITDGIVHDTTTVVDTFYTPRPVAVSFKNIKPIVKGDLFIDTSGLLTSIESDTINTDDVISDYFDLKSYSYQYPFDSLGGTITVENEVYRNSLMNQRVIPVFKKITTTKTIKQTDTLYRYRGRNIVFAGLGFYGNGSTVFTGGIVDLSLKTRDEKIYSVGRIQDFGGDGYWFGKISFPIRFNK